MTIPTMAMGVEVLNKHKVSCFGDMTDWHNERDFLLCGWGKAFYMNFRYPASNQWWFFMLTRFRVRMSILQVNSSKSDVKIYPIYLQFPKASDPAQVKGPVMALDIRVVIWGNGSELDDIVLLEGCYQPPYALGKVGRMMEINSEGMMVSGS